MDQYFGDRIIVSTSQERKQDPLNKIKYLVSSNLKKQQQVN